MKAIAITFVVVVLFLASTPLIAAEVSERQLLEMQLRAVNAELQLLTIQHQRVTKERQEVVAKLQAMLDKEKTEKAQAGSDAKKP